MQIINRKLTLDPDGANVNVLVEYDLKFNRFERNLAGLGMTFTDHAQLIGVDAPERTAKELQVVGAGPVQVPPPNDAQPVHRTYTANFSRTSLDEDPGTIVEDDDEILCRIQVFSSGIPTNRTAFTNEFILTEQLVVHQ